MANKIPQGKYIGSVKVGPKGQIVIPKEVREMFQINPGDTLLLLADAQRGIAINNMAYFNQVADEIFTSQGAPAEEMQFARAIRTAHPTGDGEAEK